MLIIIIIIIKTFGECQKVSKIWKGIFKLRPTLPKYAVIFDADIILTYMDMLPNNSSLLLGNLSKKLCILLCLLSNQRCQNIASLDLNFGIHSSVKFTFAINKVMKTTKPGKHQQPIQYYSYQENERLSVVNWTELIRENIESQPIQLISYACPYQTSNVFPHC